MRHSTRLLRSAADATRFTATSPHAYSAPSPIRRAAAGTFSPSHAPPTSSKPRAAALNPNTPQNTPPPPPPPRSTETPAQKVARLRAARHAEKAAQVNTWDRIVVTGREWADRAHRTVAWGLIAFTVIAAGVTTYALADMVVYNRRKRNAWMADQVRHNEETVTAAIANEKAGLPLTEDQELALNNERARFEAEERRKAKGWWGKALLEPFTGLVGGLKGSEGDEEGEIFLGDGREKRREGGGLVDRAGQRVYEVEEEVVDGLQKVEGEVAHGVRRAERNLKEAVQGNLSSGGKQAQEGVLASVQEAQRGTTGQVRGGPLDQMAEKAVESGKEKVEKARSGWGSWFGGK